MVKNSSEITSWPKGILNAHSEARAIDLSEVMTFIVELGYSVTKLEQRWRHVHGIVENNNSKFFFKLASTPEIGIKTKNEVAWNNAVSVKLHVQSKGMLVVPRIHQTGHLNGSFYYLAEYFEGDFPADHDPPRTDSLTQYLSSLVEVALHLNQLPTDSLQHIEGDKNHQALVERFFDEVDRWRRDSGRTDLAELRALVEPLRNNYLPQISHGDFAPWHVIIHGAQRVLIDGEHAWSGRSKYYDVAYFYHRLSTSAARPDLARKFLSEFRNGLPTSEQADFENRLVPLLASRSISGFYDATLFEDQAKVIVKHEELRSMIMAGDLW